MGSELATSHPSSIGCRSRNSNRVLLPGRGRSGIPAPSVNAPISSFKNGKKRHGFRRAKRESGLTLTRRGPAWFDLVHGQVILDAESAENLVGAHARNLFVHRAVYCSVQSDRAVVDHDPDGSRRIHRVLAKYRVAVQGAHGVQPDVVIKQRHW